MKNMVSYYRWNPEPLVLFSMTMTNPKDFPHTIPVLHKALDVVRVIALNAERSNLTTKALAMEIGISHITCYRILRTLIANDWVRPIAGGGHELSQGLLMLVRQRQPFERLLAVARPELVKLARKTELTVKVSVRQDDRAVTICRCESPRETSVSVREGASFPLAYGSSGAVLMSGLCREEIEEILCKMPPACWKYQTQEDVVERMGDLATQGYCVDAGTYNPGHFALSVPIYEKGSHCIAALTALGFPNDLEPAIRPKLATALRACSRAIAKSLLSSTKLK